MAPQHAIDEADIRQRSGVGQDAVGWGSPAARWILVATVLASGMAFLDATVVNVALPTIGAELDASVAGLQWKVTRVVTSQIGTQMSGFTPR